jgi:hypothetical protein
MGLSRAVGSLLPAALLFCKAHLVRERRRQNGAAAKGQSTETPLALIGTAHFSISLLTKRLR